VNPPRVAFFTDSYHEVNGVALTSREFAGFARRRGFPFFSLHVGPETRHWREDAFETVEIANGKLVLNLDSDLHFDLRFLRHRPWVRERLREFAPDLVHITGPGHTGLLGALLAHELKVPLVASWHTNVHEYGGRRLKRVLYGFPETWRENTAQWAENRSLDITMWFYNKARLYFAPNRELVDLLAARTHKPAHLMQRGIDSQLFSPERRKRRDDAFVIGFVGRLSPEKNLRQFQALESALLAAGASNFRFLIVGEGSERVWLREHLRHAELPGVRRGEQLAESYADMDVFAFPSETDTFGNVIVEAHASGVPAVVTNSGGPKFLVENGVNGFVAPDAASFCDAVLSLYRDREMLARFRGNARRSALQRSWDAVFEGVYGHYAEAFGAGVLAAAKATA
jgi:glycosyltransferase involved in cell wall biosynthesis